MPRSSRYAEPQRFLECTNASSGRALAAFVRFAARFCFRDLADFLVMLCLGDLSDIAALCFLGACVGPCAVSVRPFVLSICMRPRLDPDRGRTLESSCVAAP